MKENSEYLRPSQLAAKLGCSATTIINHIRAGKIHALKLDGGHYRIPRTEVERLKSEWIYSPDLTF